MHLLRETHAAGAATTRGHRSDRRHPVDPLLAFAAVALPLGGFLMALSTVVEPGEPFILATLLLALVLPALVLTSRERGRGGVRALLRDAVRLPRTWWWLPVAAFALPALSWAGAALTGGARDAQLSLLAAYVLDLLLVAVLISIWEEMVWAGFVQRRAAGRWGDVGGALVTSVLFAVLHLPLAFDGADSAGEVVRQAVLIAAVAVGVRLLIARVDPWSGRSLLTVGILHSSFNATEGVLDPSHDWVRLVVTLLLGLAAAAAPVARARLGQRADAVAP